MNVLIRHRDPTQNMARFYRLAIQLAFRLQQPGNGAPAVELVREWGRIGSPGKVRIDLVEDEAEAAEAAIAIETAKRRRGYR